MNKKTGLIALFMLMFSISTVFGLSIKGHKYKVVMVDGQDISGYGALLEMFIEFDDVLTMTVSSMGESQELEEEYEFDEETMILMEYAEDGSVVQYVLEEATDGIVMTGMGSTLVLKECIEQNEADEDEEEVDDYMQALNNLLQSYADQGYELDDYELEDLYDFFEY